MLENHRKRPVKHRKQETQGSKKVMTNIQKRHDNSPKFKKRKDMAKNVKRHDKKRKRDMTKNVKKTCERSEGTNRR